MYKYIWCEIAHTPQCPQQGHPLMIRLLIKEKSLVKVSELTSSDLEEAKTLCKHCNSFIPAE